MKPVPWARLPFGNCLVACVCVAGLISCIKGDPPQSRESTSNSCTSDDDCDEGACIASVCATKSTKFGALLFEIIPPAANDAFLGARYYKSVQLSEFDGELLIAPPLTVGGSILLSMGDPGCRPSPVEVTFVPVETYLGIDTARYSTVSRVGTTIQNQMHVDTHTYQVPGIPPGEYDVFVRDAGMVDNTATPACEVVPDVRRVNLTANLGTTRVIFNISQGPARALSVVVPSSEWQGFRADVIHATSHQLLSSRGRLVNTGEPTQDEVRAELRLSTTETDTNKMLLRLRPPPDRVAPEVSMVLAGLEVFEPGQALVPKLELFGKPVTYQTWVWESISEGGRVPGKVHFTALQLANVPAGVVASFDVWSSISEQGLVSELLPPGKYRVDVSPRAGSGYSSATSEATVWAPTPDQPGATQGGSVLQVNKVVTLSGTLKASGANPPLGTIVRLVGTPGWPSQGEPFGGQASKVSLPPNVADLVRGDLFQLDDVDCGNCTSDAPALFYNLEVLPPETSGFPRILSPGLSIKGKVPLEPLTLTLPVVVAGNVVVPERTAAEGRSQGYPGVLVRVHALLSASGEPFALGVPGCQQAPASPVCAVSAIEIASTYTGIDGAFRLLLPPGFTEQGAISAPDAGP
jgi:hypothetical protein